MSDTTQESTNKRQKTNTRDQEQEQEQGQIVESIPFQNIHSDVLFEIVKHLEPFHRLYVRGVCKKWYNIIESKSRDNYTREYTEERVQEMIHTILVKTWFSGCYITLTTDDGPYLGLGVMQDYEETGSSQLFAKGIMQHLSGIPLPSFNRTPSAFDNALESYTVFPQDTERLIAAFLQASWHLKSKNARIGRRWAEPVDRGTKTGLLAFTELGSIKEGSFGQIDVSIRHLQERLKNIYSFCEMSLFLKD